MTTNSQTTDRVCVVGADPPADRGPQLLDEGVPFDWFEKHTDVGGIWDMDNPGSPMYRSAHFISSKYTSGFYGFPMPADYPGLPDVADRSATTSATSPAPTTSTGTSPSARS